MTNRKRKRNIDWEKLGDVKDEDIDVSDNPELTDQFWDNVEVGVLSPKVAVYIRLDEDIVSWFKSSGSGYQTRINGVLRKYVDHQHKSASPGLNAVSLTNQGSFARLNVSQTQKGANTTPDVDIALSSWSAANNRACSKTSALFFGSSLPPISGIRGTPQRPASPLFDHTVNTLNGLAALYAQTGRTEDAMSIYARVLALIRSNACSDFEAQQLADEFTDDLLAK
ncbi:MAG: BrnA antitoxin family protein [Candidatus Melainabacteria bacterium]|nr:BrnA antitoxin family protein [Candidatus Melainabacteria bacterium]